LFGENKWGDTYSQAIQEKYQREYSTLVAYVSVCRNFELDRRRSNLSFTHHRELAQLPESQQETILKLAEPQEGDSRPRLSTRDVRQKVKELTSTEEGTLFKVPDERPAQDKHPAAQKYPLLRYENFGVLLDHQLDSFGEKLDQMDEDGRADALMRIRPRPERTREDGELLRWLAGFEPVTHDENGDPIITGGYDACPYCNGTGKRKYHVDEEGQVIYE
jgi:hypothetical protein